jgi:RNA polymerase sigma factor (sigma-70 family)
VAQNHLLKADAGPEAQGARAQAADRPGRQLEDAHPLAVHAQLGVDRSLPQPQRTRRPRSDRLDLGQDGRGQPRRRDVQRLLEVRPFQRLGLVEDREHLQAPAAQQPLDRHLLAGEVALQQQRRPGRLVGGGEDRPDALRGRPRLLAVVRPDDPAAARERQRFNDARKPHVAGHGRRRRLRRAAGRSAAGGRGLPRAPGASPPCCACGRRRPAGYGPGPIKRSAQAPISLEKPVGDEEESEFGQLIADEQAESPYERAVEILTTEALRHALENLSYRERRVLELRYGLGGQHPCTLDEVGRTFNLTRERIRQIENQSLKKLQNLSEAQTLRDDLEITFRLCAAPRFGA